MKKNMLILLLILISFSISYSQSIKIFELDPTYYGKVEDEEVVASGKVANMTDKTIKFKMKMEVLEIANTHSVSICWFACLDIVSNDYESPFEYTLKPFEETLPGQFSVHLYPYRKISDNPIMYAGPEPGKTKIRVIFTNVDNPDDKYSQDIEFVVVDPNSVDEGESTEFGIQNIYPNPAKDFTKIEFSYKKKEEYPHLEIFDLQGNSLYKYEICSCEDFIFLNTKEYSSGTYYVQLISENKKSKARILNIIR